jgi:hypothetical protein
MAGSPTEDTAGRTARLLEQVYAAHSGSVAEKARLTGFGTRALRRWRAEKWRTISVRDADRILEALGWADPAAQCLTAAGLAAYIGTGSHAFLQGMLEETMPTIIDAERSGVPIRRQHGLNAGRAVSSKMQTAIERAQHVIWLDFQEG